ncbi:MAG: hypothetical protein ACRD1T_13225, partial [Acidimicrobiia bacterium]
MAVARTFLAGCAAVVTMTTWGAPAVSAQAARLGETFSAFTASSTVRKPDIAFDSNNNIYFVVSGQGPVKGGFVSADGAPLGGSFTIPTTSAWTQSARTAFSPHANAFLVAWVDTRAIVGQVFGRLVAHAGGGAPSFLTADFPISGPVGVEQERGVPAVAYATLSGEFLVVWMHGNDIRAQRVANNGQLLGGEIVITADPAGQQTPGVAYNPQVNEFYVTWSQYTDTITSAVGQRLRAGTGELLGGATILHNGPFEKDPEVTFNRITGQYLVAWWHIGPGHQLLGRLVNADGSLPGAVIPIANFGGDPVGLAANPMSGSYFSVFHGDSAEDFGLEVSATGV